MQKLFTMFQTLMFAEGLDYVVLDKLNLSTRKQPKLKSLE